MTASMRRAAVVLLAYAASTTALAVKGARRSTDTLLGRGAYLAARAREDAQRAAARFAGRGDALSRLGGRTLEAGATVAVTGATSGVGEALCRELAQAGYGVVACGRSAAKVDALVARLGRLASDPARARGVVFDLESLTETRDAAASIGAVDGLVLCAGVWPTTLRYTEDELEVGVAVNHLSHFLLARELAKTRTVTRIATVSSSAHALTRADALDLADAASWTARPFDPLEAYAQAKLMNALFAAEAGRRIAGATAVAAHPGVVDTGLFSDFPSALGALRPPDPFNVLPDVDARAESLAESALGLLRSALDAAPVAPFKSARDAARDVAAGFLDASLPDGAYVSDGEATPASPGGADAAAAAALWDWSERTVDAALAAADADAESQN